jgi:thiosulfate/3-mercaptopyruvate sulfurtransferase
MNDHSLQSPRMLAPAAWLHRRITAGVTTGVTAGAITGITAGVTAVALAAVLATPASAQTLRPRADMLVSTEWLASHQNDANLVVLHVASKAQFDSGHIAGARMVSLNDVSLPMVQGGLSLQMASGETIARWAESHGIGNQTRIVVVPHDGALQSAARMVLALAYVGALDRTAMLDGSFQAWKSEGRAVTTAPPPTLAPTTFTAQVKPEFIATLAQVEAATLNRNTTLIDARLNRFYNGDGGGYPRAGHIPTAINVEYSAVSSNGYIKPAETIRTLYKTAGVPDGKPIVTYCHIGQQASIAWFVATYLGYSAQVFDGSFQEWSGTPRVPVVSPPER